MTIKQHPKIIGEKQMDRIRINIKRKCGFAGSLFRQSFFVGGKLSPAIKNGGSGSVSVRTQRVLFIQHWGSIKNNAVVFTSGEDKINLDIRTVGNIKKGFRTVFCPEGSEKPYPSVSFDRLFSGLAGQGTLNAEQRKLALLAFVMESFDSEEILRSEHVYEIIPTLKELGATSYASTLERAIASQFSGFALPITGGEDDEDMAEKFRKAEEIMTDADENDRLSEELARAAANHIAAHYNELFTIEDVFYFDGGDDDRVFGDSPAPKDRERPKPKPKPNKKQILKRVLAVLIFIAVECGVIAMWRFSAYYPARAALPENTYTVTVVKPTMKLVEGLGAHDSDKIRFTFDGETYTFDRGNVPSSVGRASELMSELENESSITLVISDDNSVCAVSGEEKTYLSVEDFNAYQKKQSVIGTVVLSIIALIILVLLIVAMAVITI